VYEGAPLTEAAAPVRLRAVGRWPRWVRELGGRGRLALFAEPGRPGPQERAEEERLPAAGLSSCAGRGLSVYEISARLAAEGTPLNRTGVGQILAEEGFGRLLRHPRA